MGQAQRENGPAVRGFGLLELLVALGLAALLVCLALPIYGDWIATTEIMNEAQHLTNSMSRARAEAINSGFRVNLCQTAGTRECVQVGTWEGGWILFIDSNGDGQVDDGETVLWTEEAAAKGVTMTANAPLKHYVSFTSHGHARLLNGALQMGTFTVCKQGQKAIDVVLAHSGRARIAKTKAICP